MAAESVASILLRITGDSSSARDELLKVSKQVQQFDSEEATASADVDTEQGRRKLKDVFGDLARIAKEKVTAKVDVDISAAEANARKVDVLMAELDRKRVDVEVDADTSRAERALARLSSFGRGGRDEFRKLSTGIRDSYTVLVGLLIPGILSLIGTLAPLATTLASAALGLGALGVAAAGVMVPAVLLAAGVMVGFEEQAKKAGTAAFKLKQRLTEFGAAFRRALAPATAQLVRGITSLLADALGVVRSLRQEMTRFGTAVRGAMEFFGNQLARSTPMLERLVALSSSAVRPLARIFANLARVLLNIAVAAMPLLVDGLRLLADETRRWVVATSDVGAMRKVFRGFIRDLVEVAEFAKQAARILLGLFAALRGPGRQSARDLTELARQTADWVNSARGQREIRRFFSETFFAIRDLGDFIRKFGPAIGAFFVTFGPSATILMRAFNALPSEVAKVVGALAGLATFAKVLSKAFGGLLLPVFRGLARVVSFLGERLLFSEGAVSRVLAVVGTAAPVFLRFAGVVGAAVSTFLILQKVMGTVRAAFSILSPFLSGFIFVIQGWKKAIEAAIPALSDLGDALVDGLEGALSAAVDVAKDIVAAILAPFRARLDAAKKAGTLLMGAVEDGLASVAGAIRDTVRSIAQRALEIVRGYVDRYRQAGVAVFTALRNGVASVAESIRSAARSILTRVIEIVRGFIDNARAAGASVFGAVRNGIASVADNIREATRSILGRVIEIIRGFVDNASAAGARVFIAVNNGMVSVFDLIRSNVRSVITRSIEIILGLATSFFNAGKALVQALANGISAAAGDAIGRLRDLAGKLRSLLPFSEPRDITSPLRGLRESGRAIVEEIAAGIARAGPLALGQLSTQLAASVSLGAPVPAATGGGLGDLAGAIRGLPTGSTVGPTVHVHAASLVPADSASLATIADVVTDALSRQGYRGAKVEVVG